MNSTNDTPELTGLRPLGIAVAVAVATGSGAVSLGWTVARELLKLRVVEARWSLQFEHVSQRVLVYDELTGSVLSLWVALGIVVAHLVFTLSVSLLSAEVPGLGNGKVHVLCFGSDPPRWSWPYAAVAALAAGCWLVAPSVHFGKLGLSAQTMVALLIALAARAGVNWFSWLRQVARVEIANGTAVLVGRRQVWPLSSLYVSGRSLLYVASGSRGVLRIPGGFARASWQPAANLLASHVEGPYRGHESKGADSHQASPPPWKLGGNTTRWIFAGSTLAIWLLVAVTFQIGGVPRAQGELLFWAGLALALLMTLTLVVPAGFSPWIYISSSRLRSRSWLWKFAPTSDRSAPSTSLADALVRFRQGGYGIRATGRRGFLLLAQLISATGSLGCLVALGACLFSGIWLISASGWVMACGLFAGGLFASMLERRVLLAFRDGALRVCVHDVWLPVTGVEARAGVAVLAVGPLEIAVHEVAHLSESAQPAETSRNRLAPACAPLSEFTVSSTDTTSHG